MPQPSLASALAHLPSKRALKDELIAHLKDQLENSERAHKAALEGATHEQAKPENDKDTRGLEQSYVARGQAKRVEDLRIGLGAVNAMPLRSFVGNEPIALGALVQIDENENRRVVFLAPHGGGTHLADGAVQVVTPHSPIGMALIGRSMGEEWDAELGAETRTLSVLALL